MRNPLGILGDFLARTYGGAKISSTTGNWAPGTTDVNEEIETSWNMIHGRTSQLVRDFPAFNNALNNIEAFVVGDGFKLQSRVRDEHSGNIDRKTSQMIEDGWRSFAESEDASLERRLNIHEMAALGERQSLEFGEEMFVKHVVDREIPFALQPMDPTRLMDHGVAYDNKTLDVFQGIAYDPQTMESKSYYFSQNPLSTNMLAANNYKKILANDIIHNFKPVRAGQLRGITPFHSVIILSHQIAGFIKDEAAAQQAASRMFAVVTTPNAKQQLNFQSGGNLNSLLPEKI